MRYNTKLLPVESAFTYLSICELCLSYYMHMSSTCLTASFKNRSGRMTRVLLNTMMPSCTSNPSLVFNSGFRDRRTFSPIGRSCR
jgi:hypothetical protein